MKHVYTSKAFLKASIYPILLTFGEKKCIHSTSLTIRNRVTGPYVLKYMANITVLLLCNLLATQGRLSVFIAHILLLTLRWLEKGTSYKDAKFRIPFQYFSSCSQLLALIIE